MRIQRFGCTQKHQNNSKPDTISKQDICNFLDTNYSINAEIVEKYSKLPDSIRDILQILLIKADYFSTAAVPIGK